MCVKNADYETSLEVRNIYQALPDALAAEHRQVRVIDQSGEDYLFPEHYFVPITLPKAAERAVLRSHPE